MSQNSGAARVLPTDPPRPQAIRRPGAVGPLVLAAALGSGVLAAPAAAADPAPQAPNPHRGDANGVDGTIPVSRTLGAPVRHAGSTYHVRAGDTVSHIALRTGVSQAAIIAANNLNRAGFIRAGQTLTIPSAGALSGGTTAAAPVRNVGTTYRVQAGDTVSHIAARTGLSQAAIIAANGLNRNGFIRVGQVLTLPSSGGGGTAAKSVADQVSAPTTRYTVQPGDTVSQIALRAGVTQAAIIAANKLNQAGFIRAGQVLTLPGKAAPAPSGAAQPAKPASSTSSGSTTAYTVRAGDTLSHIAARNSTTVAALRAANPGLDDRGTIRVGQQLRVPAAPAPMPNTFAGRTYPEATVRAATANRDALAARDVPSREQMRQIIAATAREHGVDPALAQAVAFQESGFNQRAVSPANAVGAMQVIPSSGQWASDMAGRRLDLLDPHDNATAGVLIMRANLRAADDLPQAIAAYYQGLSSVRKNGMYADTRRYVANVQTLMARYR